MKPFKSQWTALAGYPNALSDAVRGIDVRVQQETSGTLTLRYVLRAEMLHVRVPPPQAPARCDGLWKHTCFEAFIAPTGTERPATERSARKSPAGAMSGGYYELNFSPSGQWAIYSFSAYRDGMSPTDVTAAPAVLVRHFDDRLELDATIGLADLQGVREARTLKLALTTVVEDDSGTLSYWALKHAPGKPDFHHSDGFVLELPQ